MEQKIYLIQVSGNHVFTRIYSTWVFPDRDKAVPAYENVKSRLVHSHIRLLEIPLVSDGIRDFLGNLLFNDSVGYAD